MAKLDPKTSHTGNLDLLFLEMYGKLYMRDKNAYKPASGQS